MKTDNVMLSVFLLGANRQGIFTSHIPAFLPNLFIFKEKIKRIFHPVRAGTITLGFFLSICKKEAYLCKLFKK